LKNRLALVVASATIGFGGLAAPIALATNNEPQKCNAGRGNGSEGCDPGKSSTSSGGGTGQNQGGDEGGPIQGGTGAP
jgi:hypothetical protein